MKILGVIGGLGPETGCTFCLNINNKFKRLTNVQPHILLDNLPISQEAETRLINGGASQEHLKLLQESIRRLNKLNTDAIVITCNTVHIFINELRQQSKTPILSIIEETAKECKKQKLTKVGLLASTKTIKEGLHSKELKKNNIEVISPGEEDQKFISECIVRIINNKTTEKDEKKIMKIILKLKNKGAQAVILGCTDLPLLTAKLKLDLPVINTTSILEDAAIKTLLTTNKEPVYVAKIRKITDETMVPLKVKSRFP